MTSILKEIQISNFLGDRGELTVAEFRDFDLFVTKRIYYISSVPQEKSRGAHAHKSLKQIFFALSGDFVLKVTDGAATEAVKLNANGSGYYLQPGYWRDISEFSSGAICLVIASEHYDPNDYIHSFDDYLRWRRNEQN